MNKKPVYLKRIEYPDFGEVAPIIFPSVDELESRLQKCRKKMHERGLSHLVVYGDREHFANLMYLVHFDPRFEEALLIIDASNTPLLLVGNECVSHLSVSPMYNAKKLRYERYQSFSLVGQPRDESRSLENIFRSEGISSTSKIGCVGWKYFDESEFSNAKKQIDIPSFITDTLRSISGFENIENATDLLISSEFGLKSNLSAFEIAHFEWSNSIGSNAMKHLLQNFKTGVTDFELIREYQYNGYPLGCHIGFKSSGNQHIGLSSPVGSEVKLGEPCSTGIAYWGSNICRAGWVAKNENDLPQSAKGYVDNFATPYFAACCEWYSHLKIGTKGKDIRSLIDKLLPFDQFGVFLNPGHLIHYEEWMSSPIYKDSEEEIRSGMYIQVDIIPRSKNYFSSRMEEGVIIADDDLQRELKDNYPDTYARCIARRNFMQEVLGISLPKEILPLSNIPAIVPPFFLDHTTIMSLKP